MFAQSLKGISRYEKRWALFHPFAAIKVKKITKKCWPHYSNVKTKQVLDTYESGGKLDAFRHVFFMAALSQKIKPRKLRKLGIAHEKGNYKQFLNDQNEQGEQPDSLGTLMDLKNNEVGFGIGKENKKISLEDLKLKVISTIKSGDAFYFKRNTNGDYLNCNDQIIDLRNYSGKWFVPKCLVKTNE